MLSSIILAVVVIVICVTLALILVWITSFRMHKSDDIEQPFVSILIAARNEESNIANCLEGLLKLDYPKEKLEILVGDDESTDSTFKILKEYSTKYACINAFELKGCRGKADVLAEIAEKAKGEFYLFTDVDIQVSPQWIRGMLAAYQPEDGVISGITTVVGDKLWYRLQNIDWVFSLTMVKLVTDIGYPVTAVGNNMLVPRSAYKKTGGFKSIPFSVVEDYELSKLMLTNGYEVKSVINSNVLLSTKGQDSWRNLLQQRKRWMIGAFKVPWPLLTILILQATYYPAIFLLFFIHTELAFGLFFLKALLQFYFISMAFKKLNKRLNILHVFFYEFYAAVISLGTLLFYLLPFKVVWKGRSH